MGKGVMVQVVLLALALVWAYRLAHPPPETSTAGAEAIPLWRLAPDAVSRIIVTEPNTKVTLTPRSVSGEGTMPADSYIWVETAVSRPASPNPGEEETVASSANPKPVLATAAFKGNRAARQVVATFLEPLASRRIGNLEDLDADAFGLGEPDGSVVLENAAEGVLRRLELGGFTYGNHNRYVLLTNENAGDTSSKGAGTVYLIPAAVTENLKRPARRLLDRDLFPFDPTAAFRAELRVAGKVVNVWRLIEDDSSSQDWARDPNAESGDEAIQAWIRDLARLRVDAYANLSDLDGKAGAQDSLVEEAASGIRIILHREGVLASTLLLQGRSAGKTDGTITGNSESSRRWIARSTYTEAPVLVNGQLAQQLVDTAREWLNVP